MELLFNLLWVVLSIGLIGLWLISGRRWGNYLLRPNSHVQIAALAILIVILFPVVSLTDDLLACTAPAEVEHLVRRHLQEHVENSLESAAILAAALVSYQSALGLQVISHTSPSMKIGTPREAFLNAVGNRPPPHA